MEKEQRYISYVIGTAPDGTSLDSDESTNQYTSVFFDKEVLTLYHGRQGCKIEPLRISSPDFSLRCDNDNLDYVVVFYVIFRTYLTKNNISGGGIISYLMEEGLVICFKNNN